MKLHAGLTTGVKSIIRIYEQRRRRASRATYHGTSQSGIGYAGIVLAIGVLVADLWFVMLADDP